MKRPNRSDDSVATGARSGERGSAALEFPMVVGMLLMPFGVFLLSVSTWVERQTAARDAAAETGRYLVSADGSGDVSEIVAAVEAGYGLAPGSLVLDVGGSADPGGSVTTSVTVEIPGLTVPLFGSVGGVSWTADHVERFPDYGASS